MSERVGAALRKEGKSAKRISLKLRYADFDTISRSISLKNPVDTNEAIFDTGVMLIAKAFQRRRHPVRLIGIGVSNLTSRQRQLDIFDPALLKLEHLNEAIDSIRSRYGQAAIQTGAVLTTSRNSTSRKLFFLPAAPCL